jgi:WD40 repeat protein
VEQSIHVYDVGGRSFNNHPTLVTTLNDHEHTVRGLSAADDGSWFASVGGGSTKRRLFIWSTDEGAAGKIVVFMRFRTDLDVSALAVAAVQRPRRTDESAGPVVTR